MLDPKRIAFNCTTAAFWKQVKRLSKAIGHVNWVVLESRAHMGVRMPLSRRVSEVSKQDDVSQINRPGLTKYKPRF